MAALTPWASRQNSLPRGLDAWNIPLNGQWSGNFTLDELDRNHLGWSQAWQQEWGLFLLEWLFYTASTMRKREQQCFRWRCPPWATVVGDTAPVQSSVWILLGFTNEDILRVTKDIYHGQYQLALSILTHQCQDLLMQNLHSELNWRLVRAGLHGAMQTAPWCGWSTMCSGRSHTRGRTCSHVPPWAPSLS